MRSEIKKERAFNDQSISDFKIGYAANGGLSEHLTEFCGFKVEDCLKAGVLKKTSDGSIGDYFFERIIFPNLKGGRVVHFTGRSVNEQEPKYLHLPGKLEYLFNEDALLNPEVLVTEGVTDCIAATQAGYKAVGIFGVSNFNSEYLPKFTCSEIIYLCFDADPAGREGSLRIGGIIGDRAKVVILPDGYDLNDFLRENPKTALETLVSSAKDPFKYAIEAIPPDTDKTDLPQALDSVLKALAGLDEVKSDSYLQHCIKPHFGLTNKETKLYEKKIKEYRSQKSEELNETASDPKPNALFDNLIDLVEHDGTPAFLIANGNELVITKNVEIDGVSYVPPDRAGIPWLLPRGEEVLKYYRLRDNLSQREMDSALFLDLVRYHKEISELPTDAHYDLIAAWDFHTYLLENVRCSPIICLFAVPERGKSRTGKGMIYVAYRGLHVESLREAYIMRVANNFNATIFFDVKDIWNKAQKNNSEDILLQRFEKGTTVPRVNYPDRGPHRDTTYYLIFGPTIIGTNSSVDEILETRAVTINMPESDRLFENEVTPEDALQLKERLVAFRAAHLGETLPVVEKPVRGRLGDIMRPILQIIRLVKPDREVDLLKLVKGIQEGKRADMVYSLEARLLALVLDLREGSDHAVLPVMEITKAYNAKYVTGRATLTPRRIASVLASMGFERQGTGTGASGILWDSQMIERLMVKYGLSNPIQSE